MEGPRFGGEFLEIVPNRRIAYSDGFEDGKGGGMNLQHARGRMVFTTIFDDQSDRTTIVAVSVFIASVAMTDEFLIVGMAEGLKSSLDQWEDVAREVAA